MSQYIDLHIDSVGGLSDESGHRALIAASPVSFVLFFLY
jgi:hypothetical protein